MRPALPILLLATLAVLLTPTSALAHAKLESVQPADGAALEAAPDAVVITFTKPVTELVRDASITPPSGEPITDAWSVDERRIILTLPTDAPTGAWQVDWSVTGADGHPMRGAASFTVGTGAVRGADGGDAYPTARVDRIGIVARFPFYVGLLLGGGGLLFAILVAPGWRVRGLPAAALACALGAWIVLGAHVALVDERSLIELADPRAWFAELGSVALRGMIVAAGLLLVLASRAPDRLTPEAWRERSGRLPRLLLAATLVAIAVPAISGHSGATDAPPLRTLLDAVHLLAAAAWIGGLVQLRAMARARRTREDHLAVAAVRYSRVALASVAVLVATGIAQTLSHTGASVGELTGTTWGRLVLAKVLLLTAAMPLARANHRRNVPQLTTDPAVARTRLGHMVTIELGIVALVLAATSWLVYATPPA